MSVPPRTILSGLKKSSTAVPSLKNSGLNVNLKTVHLDEQKRDLFEFSKGKTPCVVKETEKGFSLIFSDDDLNKFNGDVEFFMNSLKSKITNGH